MAGLVYSGEDVFNSYRHFGHPSVWPCGYPIDKLGFPHNDTYRVGSKWKTPIVQQGLVNGEPDLDSSFRLTRKWRNSHLDLTFDPTAPATILPEGTYSPVNTQNTFFWKEAFWGLQLPMTPNFRVIDIWRGYWLQRLLWEMGGHVGFFPPNVYHVRNFHNDMKDLKEDYDIYLMTHKLLNFLSNWSCPQNFSFFRCMYLLSFDMNTAQFWGEGDVDLTRQWINDLISIGYEEPERIMHVGSSDTLLSKIFDSDLIAKREATLSRGAEVTFFANWKDPPSQIEENGVRFSISDKSASGLAAICSDFSLINSVKEFTKQTHEFFHRTLLVVTISGSINSKYIDSVLKSVFPTIAYCGRKADKVAMLRDPYFRDNFTFISITPEKMAHIQSLKLWCMFKAIEMSYNVSGIFVTGSDVLLNFGRLQNLNAQRFWVDGNTRSFRFKTADPYQDKIINLALSDILQNNETPKTIFSPKHFASNLRKRQALSVSFKKSLEGQVFYIPQALVASVVHFYKYFTSLGAVNTFAFACIINGLINGDEFERLYGQDMAITDLTASSVKQFHATHFMFNFTLTNDLEHSLCRHKFFI